jgi:hypothetical protein
MLRLPDPGQCPGTVRIGEPLEAGSVQLLRYPLQLTARPIVVTGSSVDRSRAAACSARSWAR